MSFPAVSVTFVHTVYRGKMITLETGQLELRFCGSTADPVDEAYAPTQIGQSTVRSFARRAGAIAPTSW